ncbi:MAG TPA: hypothetical protein VI032_18960 [Burkholderiaceae bacterium]
MLSRDTIDAAARVTEYAACRPLAFNPTPPADDAGLLVNDTDDAAAAGPDRPQGNPDVQTSNAVPAR